MYTETWNPFSPDFWHENNFPLTKLIIYINFVTMALFTFRVPIAEWIAFRAPESLFRPWTLLTYPLLSMGIIEMLFHGLWLFFVGGSLERSWGTRFYAKYFAAMTLIGALAITLGAFILRIPVWAENWLPIAALTITFCTMNPSMQINLWGIIPVQARWLAVGEAVIVFFMYAQRHANPFIGFFALIPCAAAYFWARASNWGSFSLYASTRINPRASNSRQSPPLPRDDASLQRRSLNPFEWYARRRRKKQFERLMKDD